SIDYAVMEHTGSAAVLPVDIGWSDVGSWSSLWELGARDADGNVVNGDALLEATTNSYVHSERALVATLGVEDLIIVDTPDALLRERESACIVASQSRRLERRGKAPVALIEVPLGSYLGEADIVRADDVYTRTPDETR